MDIFAEKCKKLVAKISSHEEKPNYKTNTYSSSHFSETA